MMCFTRLVLVALTLAAAGKAFAGSNPSFKYPTGSKQTTVSATTGRTVEQGSVNGDGRRLILPVDTPAVKVNLFGREYSVKERRVCLPVRIVEKQKQGVAAFWDSPRKEIVLTQQDYDSYMRKYEKGGGSGTVMDIVRHEGIHASVSQEFGKLYEDESGYPMPETSDWYHFLHEMLAYVGGDGMSEKNAAKQIISGCEEEEFQYLGGLIKWYRCSKKSYPSGSRDIARKFLDGKSYMPPVLQGDRGVRSDEEVRHDEKNVIVADKIPDLSKLVDLLKQTMEQLRKINAKNSKPSDKDFKDHNMLVGEACNEVRKIGDEVRKMHLSEQKRIRMGEELDRLWGEKIKQYCKTIEELRKQIEAKGYGHFESNLNFDPKSFK